MNHPWDSIKVAVVRKCSVKIISLAVRKYLLPSVKVGSKTNIPGSKNWWPYIKAYLTSVQVVVRFKELLLFFSLFQKFFYLTGR